MGADRAHFSKQVKCGERRIAPVARDFGPPGHPSPGVTEAVGLVSRMVVTGLSFGELDLHPCPEAARPDPDPFGAERVHHAGHERLRLLGAPRPR